jgi:hypothetical protein
MSSPNNFNPFRYPYHPIQIVIFGTVLVLSLPFTFLYTAKDGGEQFRSSLRAIKDIPKSVVDTIKGSSEAES